MHDAMVQLASIGKRHCLLEISAFEVDKVHHNECKNGGKDG